MENQYNPNNRVKVCIKELVRESSEIRRRIQEVNNTTQALLDIGSDEIGTDTLSAAMAVPYALIEKHHGNQIGRQD